MPGRGDPRLDKVWVRADCIGSRGRGPYHWTRKCLEGRVLIELDRL